MQLLLLLLSFLSLTLPSTARIAKRQMTACQYTCFLGVCQPRCGFSPSTILDQMCIDSCQIACGMECDRKEAADDYYEKFHEKKEGPGN